MSFQKFFGNSGSDSALAIYELGCRQVPQDGPLYIALGQLYERQGNLAKAEETYRQGTVGSPKLGLNYYHLVRVLLAHSNVDTARQITEDVMARTRHYVFSYCALAEVHLRTRDFSEARAICRRGLDAGGAMGQLYALLVETSERESDLAGAMELCHEWVKACPGDGNGYVALVTRLCHQGDWLSDP